MTGGAGFIGLVTTEALVEAGHEVTVLDDLSAGHPDLLAEGVGLIRGQVGDPAAVTQALTARPDAVVHLAARIEAGESMRHPEQFFENNTAQTLRFLRQLIEAGVNRFVFSSTAAVYGDPVRTPIAEEDPTVPTNAYGESKLLVERTLEWLNRIHGFRYASLRYFNAAGAVPGIGELHEPETHLIPQVLRVATGDASEAVIFGDDYPTPDGTCVRDYIHVADLADAHVRAVEALADVSTVICNLGNGNGFSVREVIEACRRATGHPIPARIGPRRPGDPAVLIASSERARQILGWTPRFTSIDEIVGSAWNWHRAHADGSAG